MAKKMSNAVRIKPTIYANATNVKAIRLLLRSNISFFFSIFFSFKNNINGRVNVSIGLTQSNTMRALCASKEKKRLVQRFMTCPMSVYLLSTVCHILISQDAN